MLDLRGRRALVTGAARRVGRAIALALAKQGASVAVHFHESEREAELTAHALRGLGVQAEALGADLSDSEQCHDLIARSAQALGGLDLLVSSAANFERVPFDEIQDAVWQSALDLNARATLHLARAAAPWLRAARGSIVCITCASNAVPMRHYLPYQASKAALRQMVRALALELAPEVRVNAVAPGTVLPPEDYEAARLQRLRQRIPLGRFGTPEDVAEAVTYLATANFITGQELYVDGGRSVAAFESFT